MGTSEQSTAAANSAEEISQYILKSARTTCNVKTDDMYSKTGRGTKSHIALRAKVACSLKFSSIGAHFAPPLHSSSFVSGRKILREVPFNLPCNHGLSGRPTTFPSGGKVTNQVFSQTDVKAFQIALSVML
ncbi:hypothetical protein OS493_019358 [Desmophyllum pertusum]|uniref:Uncharacterized protein n=1 Tax=Desmophyllum pertusum TaxID=174260 RepID=A0A9X0D8H3_9CNID|nr:hypothetical protein OS493_019358 [Desmophyllum pertusum]